MLWSAVEEDFDPIAFEVLAFLEKWGEVRAMILPDEQTEVSKRLDVAVARLEARVKARDLEAQIERALLVALTPDCTAA